ncbi:acyl carrier protein [Kitasatospora sp. NBC_01302]|uniref:acyl carrier protein n=1 Tax=Kitasatospora sp. NBC_01302 TaxID=2903575 RepID=UPI002E0E3CD5|nr:acyl carrier protein [Kitasatospora sp. NBC_01302]
MAARFAFGALRDQARAGSLAPLFRGLVRTPSRRVAGTVQAGPATTLREQLAGVPEAEWDALVLELVRGTVAEVLGHASAEAVRPDRPLKELGFGSLSAVGVRNRLTTVTGLRLRATVVFDHPSPLGLRQVRRTHGRFRRHRLAQPHAGERRTRPRQKRLADPVRTGPGLSATVLTVPAESFRGGRATDSGAGRELRPSSPLRFHPQE